MYAPRKTNITKLLQLFADKKEIFQSELEELTKVSYRNNIRQLQILQQLGLIELARVEPCKEQGKRKQGRGKQVWKITFSGLLQALRLMSDRIISFEINTLDHIAEVHNDKWLIFQEWAYLSKDADIKNLVIKGLELNYLTQHVQEVNYAAADTMKRIYETVPAARAIEDINSKLKERDCTNAALWLYDTLHLEIWPYHVYQQPEGTDYSQLACVKVPRYALKNPNLRMFIEEQFRIEDQRHKIIKDFGKALFGKEGKYE